MENLFKSCSACRKSPFSCLCRPVLRRTTVSYLAFPNKLSNHDIMDQYNHFETRRKMTRIQKK